MMKIVCLGDSLTEGYNIDLSLRWTNQLAELVELPIINSGISGDTTAGMLSRFSTDVLLHKPTHLVLMGGTNDLYFDLDDKFILANIKTMVRQAQHHNIVSIIGLPTMIRSTYEPDSGLFISEQKLIKRMTHYRTQLEAFAKADGLSLIDFNEGLDRSHFLADGVHPNEVAQGVMAKVTASHFLSLRA